MVSEECLERCNFAEFEDGGRGHKQNNGNALEKTENMDTFLEPLERKADLLTT